MKKLSIIMIAAALALSAYAANTDVLKDKSNFSKVELFAEDSVFSNPQINAEVVKAYEANPDAYSDKELFPVAICYMTLHRPEKTKAMLEKYIASSPNDAKAIRTYANILAVFGDFENALSNFKKSYALGDKESAKLIALILLQTNRIDDVKEYLPELSEFAKTDLGVLNILLSYAYRNQNNRDVELAKRSINAAQAGEMLKISSLDTFVMVLNLYMVEKGVWNANSLILPARGAMLSGHWGLARSLYSEILEANPNNIDALKGKSIVEFNLGGINEASALLDKILALGDKSVINDAMELFIVSKNQGIFEKYKKNFENFDFSPKVRLAMLGFAANTDGRADMLFMALSGEGVKPLLENERIAGEIKTVLKKYESDPRSKEFLKKLSK